MSTAGKFTLSNTYKNINPDIVLIKSHGLQTNEHTKIHGHATHTVNSSEEMHDGSAVLAKHNLKYRREHDFDADFLRIALYTNTGPISLATTCPPPRRPHLPITDFH